MAGRIEAGQHGAALSQVVLHIGAGLSVVWTSFVALFVIGLVFFVMALSRFRRTISQMA